MMGTIMSKELFVGNPAFDGKAGDSRLCEERSGGLYVLLTE